MLYFLKYINDPLAQPVHPPAGGRFEPQPPRSGGAWRRDEQLPGVSREPRSMLYFLKYINDPLAQPVEQLPFKPWVRGSNPRRVTKTRRYEHALS